MTLTRGDAWAVTDGQVPRPGSPAAELATKPGLRMRPYRPVRALAGAFVVIASVVAAIALYSRIGDRTDVLAVNRTVLAGEQLTAADLEVVSISSDDHLAFVGASDRGLVVGQYARVRLAADSLLVPESLQPTALVDPGRVLMSVEVPAGQIPVGLREQSRLVLVVTASGWVDRRRPGARRGDRGGGSAGSRRGGRRRRRVRWWRCRWRCRRRSSAWWARRRL